MYYVETEPRQREWRQLVPGQSEDRFSLSPRPTESSRGGPKSREGQRYLVRVHASARKCKQVQASEADDTRPITPRSIASPPDSHTLAPTCSIESPVWAATCSEQAYDEGPGTPHGLETTSCNLSTPSPNLSLTSSPPHSSPDALPSNSLWPRQKSWACQSLSTAESLRLHRLRPLAFAIRPVRDRLDTAPPLSLLAGARHGPHSFPPHTALVLRCAPEPPRPVARKPSSRLRPAAWDRSWSATLVETTFTTLHSAVVPRTHRHRTLPLPIIPLRAPHLP
jgi:hypothetical protein